MSETSQKFGTLKGVYIPSVLTIFGVIMYLRMGWMVANVGLIGSMITVTLASLITFFTALSIAATATNMRVGAGGAYYMISRSFGIETGAAIGIPLFLAQSLGIAFYISGFSESVSYVFPWMPQLTVSLISLTILFVLCFSSADLTLKIQSFIFGLIILSLISFFLGDGSRVSVQEDFVFTKVGFWVVFAVIFPAVTGIEAGLAMSGDLKDPSKSLPKGTILAVITGYIAYMVIPIFLYYKVPTSALASNFLVMIDFAWMGIFVIVGIWGSTLSSAVGSLLGGPRTLQALSKDRVLFSFFAKSSGKNQLPQRATVASFIIAFIALILGDLNSIAGVLSMFFLTSYGLINLASLSENFMKNPSWRPSFKIHWGISFLGFFLCFTAMLLINAAAALIAFALVIVIYTWTKKRNLGKHWSDIRRGMLINAARNLIYKLSQTETDARSWRPNIVVFSGSPNQRFPLIDLGRSLNSGRGFLTVCSILSKEYQTSDRKKSMESSMREFFAKKKVEALPEIHFAKNPFEGAVAFSENYGLASLKPNLFIFGQSADEKNIMQYSQTIMDLYRLKRNVIILRNHTKGEDKTLPIVSNEIHVWWGRQAQNASLMLALAYLISLNPERKKTKICLKTSILKEDEREKAKNTLEHLIENARMPIDFEVAILPDNLSIFQMVQEKSSQADLLFIGIRPPKDDETVEDYAKYYQHLLEQTENFPPTAMVMSSEEISFKEIFEGL